MNQDQLKQAVAQAAVDLILPQLSRDSVIGVGTGSTANFFIDLLAKHKLEFDGAGQLPGHRRPAEEPWHHRL